MHAASRLLPPLLPLGACWRDVEVRVTNRTMALTTEGSRTNVTVIIAIAGRIDGETAADLDRVCQQWLTPDDSAMILDFSEVSYISSAGLSSVLRAGKEIDRQGGRLLVCGLASRLQRVFSFAGFDALFPLFETREAALDDCQERALRKTR